MTINQPCLAVLCSAGIIVGFTVFGGHDKVRCGYSQSSQVIYCPSIPFKAMVIGGSSTIGYVFNHSWPMGLALLQSTIVPGPKALVSSIAESIF